MSELKDIPFAIVWKRKKIKTEKKTQKKTAKGCL